jgi:tetratricopeptide (TPR) repeat protein
MAIDTINANYILTAKTLCRHLIVYTAIMKIQPRIIAATIAMLLYMLPSRACINEYRAHLNGTLEYGEGGYGLPGYGTKDDIYNSLRDAKLKYVRSKNLEDYSDYGAWLLRAGQTEDAKHIFIAVEKQQPGLYNTAANLGTAYELLGKNDSAFIWIKKALDINTESHRRSEWIHLKILEAKIKANGNDTYYLTHDILGLDFGDDIKPVYKGTMPIMDLYHHLSYQLGERMALVQPKDAIVAQLLFNYGNTTAITRDVSAALVVYYKAKEYGYSSTLMDKRIARFESLEHKAEFMGKVMRLVKKYFLEIALALLCIGIIEGIVFLSVLQKWWKARKAKSINV